jgi:hypothetical protein
MHGSFLQEMSNPIGIVGVVLILIAYYYLSIGRWVADSLLYQCLNFAGAWLILYSLYFNWNWASVIIEVAWIVISVIGIYRALTTENNKI